MFGIPVVLPTRKRITNKTTGKMEKMQRLPLGLALSSGIAMLPYRRRSLNRSGVAGTITTGTAILPMGGWAWGLSLIYFFIPSIFLSHFRERAKARTVADKLSKASQ